MERFVQSFAPMPDPYAGDHVLLAHLDRLLGQEGHALAKGPLSALAAEVAGPLREAHAEAEAHPPELIRYDGWGRRVDRVHTPTGWRRQKRAAAEHGVVAFPYERESRARFGAGARVVQHALLHLFGPESATFSCPVAMSDGAAALLSRDDAGDEVRAAWLPRLISRDPDIAVTSGQWMTETAGGSDVGRTDTVARQDGDGWRLTGQKWFCSAIDSAMAVALARPEGAVEGSRGLANFLVPRYAADVPGAGGEPGDTAPGMRIHRLKDKLGTRALPSAEVGLDGAYAIPVGDPTRPGLSLMMTLIQVTRLHNAAVAAAGMRRGLMIVRNHAASREAFGTPLWRQPLHRETLGWLAVDAEAAFALAGLCFELLGKYEVGAETGDVDAGAVRLLRLAATLAKLGTGKLAVASASEYVECIGGNGYIEDTGVPRLLRDSQVLPIWEGTTNVLSLDVLRALARDDVAPAYLAHLDAAAERASGGELATAAGLLRTARSEVAEALAGAASAGRGAEPVARDLALRLAWTLAGAAMLDQASHDIARGDTRSALVAELWMRRRLGGESCAGEGDRHFAHLVDGEPR
jgi:acyl-CoA dehydrogenase